MKQPKKPTREQKKKLAEAGLNWKEWSVVLQNGTAMAIQEKKSGKIRTI